MGYDIKTNDVTFKHGFSELTTVRQYNGEGGLHRAYVGLGYAPLRNLSIGVNASYLWGVTSHTATTSFTDASVPSPRVLMKQNPRTPL